MGDAEGNNYVPFQINYMTNSNANYTLWNPKVYSCGQSIDVRYLFICKLW